jgi:hypothetical protein
MRIPFEASREGKPCVRHFRQLGRESQGWQVIETKNLSSSNTYLKNDARRHQVATHTQKLGRA